MLNHKTGSTPPHFYTLQDKLTNLQANLYNDVGT